MNMDKQKLKMDCSTPWNSMLYMIHGLVTNRWPVSAVLLNTTVTKDKTVHLILQYNSGSCWKNWLSCLSH